MPLPRVPGRALGGRAQSHRADRGQVACPRLRRETAGMESVEGKWVLGLPGRRQSRRTRIGQDRSWYPPAGTEPPGPPARRLRLGEKIAKSRVPPKFGEDGCPAGSSARPV
jgi:hypothetical protein